MRVALHIFCILCLGAGTLRCAELAPPSKGLFIMALDGTVFRDKEAHGEEVYDERYSPCSTFKVALSLMGYDCGILVDAHDPVWDYREGYVGWLERWKKPHNPALWLSNSCVWYSQVLTQKLKMTRFADYVKKLAYGNQDTSGDVGKNNGLTHCWLMSSLKISLREQLHFMQKLVKNQLPVSEKAHTLTKKIMFVEKLKNGWTLYGKTGSGSMHGWFVGFALKGARTLTFAYLLRDQSKQKELTGSRAKEALKLELNKVISSI